MSTTITKATVAKMFPPSSGKGITKAAALKEIEGNVTLEDGDTSATILDKLVEKELVVVTGGKYTLAPPKEAKSRRVADADRKKAVSTAPTEGTQVDEYDGKTYPLKAFPTYKDAKTGETLRRTVTRANQAAAKDARTWARAVKAADEAAAKEAAKEAKAAEKAAAAEAAKAEPAQEATPAE